MIYNSNSWYVILSKRIFYCILESLKNSPLEQKDIIDTS